MSKTVENITAEALVAQAAEQKLVTPTVPPQDKGEEPKVSIDEFIQEDSKDDQSEPADLTLIKGDKKTLKERAAAFRNKLKNDKKAQAVAVGVLTVGLATVAYVKFVAQKATEVIEIVEDDELDEDDITTADADDNA
jgi:hypothetical protein